LKNQRKQLVEIWRGERTGVCPCAVRRGFLQGKQALKQGVSKKAPSDGNLRWEIFFRFLVVSAIIFFIPAALQCFRVTSF
jgi:hypothetical protein